VAQKVEKHTDNETTTFVSLLHKPKTSIEAIALAKSIDENSERLVQAGDSKAFLTEVVRNDLLDNLDNWGRFTFLPNLEIMEEVVSLLSGELKIGNQNVNVPVTKFNNLIASIGVDRHRFTDTFKVLSENIPGSVPILHGGEEEQRLVMHASANSYAIPIIERGKKVFQEIAAHLLVPNRIRVDTAHVVSLLSDERIIANIFYAVRVKSESQEKLKTLCLWFTTTWGILTVLASREETQGAFISLNQSHWRMLPVLDIDKLTKKEITDLAAVFDMFKDKQPSRIPDQFGSEGKIDDFRIELDTAFLNALGIAVEKEDLLLLYHEIGSSLKQWIGD
jgi:hypothetical protein